MTKGGITLLCTIVVLCFMQGEADNVKFPAHLSFTLRPKKWPAWHVVIGNDSNGVLHGDNNAVHLEGKFKFERINANEPYFYMKSTKSNELYVYMTNTAIGTIKSTRRIPGPEGIWKITATSDGMFTFSPKKWPSWYMCMQGNSIGTMIGCNNVPGDTGTFTVTSVEAESIQFPSHLSFTLRPKKNPAWHVVMGNDSNGVLHGDKNAVHLEGKFKFERINANEPYFYMKSTKSNELYVYMTNTAIGTIKSIRKIPGPEGIWKVTATSDGMFTFSPKKWPSWYMCMQDDSIGTMIGCNNVPGDTGTFTVTSVEAESIQCPTHLSFTLRPKQWPAWHVVMGSDSNGVLHGDKNAVHLEGKFYFERINANEPYFHMKSTKSNELYVYMTNTTIRTIKSIRRIPGPEGIWKITPTSDKMFTFSPKEWPAWYMCMQGNSIGTMIGCKNTPGDTGTFTVTLAEEESIFMYAILCY